jgi:hypothetical protein
MISNVDNKLIDEIAKIWVESGGDKEGIYYCLVPLANRVQELIDEKKQEVEK